MSKRNKIIYWIATLWFCLGMVSTGIVQLMRIQNEGDFIHHLGYPEYFLQLIGFWKIAGVPVLLLPIFPKLKEWAYAGFFFLVTGAIYSHLVYGDGFNLLFPSIFLFFLLILSRVFRPHYPTS